MEPYRLECYAMEGKTRRAIAVVVMFILAIGAGAAGGLRPALAQSGGDTPFVGVVEQNGVEVRAGAGKTFYVVGSLKQGTMVQVDEVIFGWYKIQPPTGVGSYVSKAYVNARGDGKTGLIARDRSPVRSASLAGPGDSYRKQLDLNQGDEVTILAEEGSFYKIASPKGAYVYIEPGTLRRATAEQAAQFAGQAVAGAASQVATQATQETAKPTTASKPEAKTPATEPVTEPAPQKIETKRPEPLETEVATKTDAASPRELVGPPEPQRTQSTGGALAKIAGSETATETPIAKATQASDAGTTDQANQVKDALPDAAPPAVAVAPAAPKAIDYRSLDVAGLEQQLVLTANLPLEQRPVAELLAAYRARLTDQTITVYDQRLITFRLKQLERTAQAKEAIVKIAEARAQLNTNEPNAAADVIKVAEARAASPAYVAFGRLTASTVYNGESLPRLYRVVEPHTFRTVAYVRPGGGVTADRVGSVVGIVGTSAMDPALQIEVVTPTSVDLLEAVTDARPTSRE